MQAMQDLGSACMCVSTVGEHPGEATMTYKSVDDNGECIMPNNSRYTIIYMHMRSNGYSVGLHSFVLCKGGCTFSTNESHNYYCFICSVHCTTALLINGYHNMGCGLWMCIMNCIVTEYMNDIM